MYISQTLSGEDLTGLTIRPSKQTCGPKGSINGAASSADFEPQLTLSLDTTYCPAKGVFRAKVYDTNHAESFVFERRIDYTQRLSSNAQGSFLAKEFSFFFICYIRQ